MDKSVHTSSVYCVTELIGTSESSWEDAAKHAVETATKTLRDLRVAEVNKLDLVIVDGKVTAFRARGNVSFKHNRSQNAGYIAGSDPNRNQLLLSALRILSEGGGISGAVKEDSEYFWESTAMV